MAEQIGRVYLSNTIYSIGQFYVDIMNMDEEVLNEIDRRVDAFIPAAMALLSKRATSAVSSAQKKRRWLGYHFNHAGVP